MSDYWTIEPRVQDLCNLARASLRETSIDRGPLGSTVRLTCIGIGLIMLARERAEGDSVELKAHRDALYFYGATPGSSTRPVLELLGWHESKEGGDTCWKAYP